LGARIKSLHPSGGKGGFAKMSVDAMKATQIPAGAATAAIPRHIRELFGEPPLLRSESRDAYDALWSALVVQFDPREIMEWAWVRDLADLTWEVARMRRAMTAMLNVSFKSGLRGTLRAVTPFVATLPPEPEVLAEAWYDASSGQGEVAATLAAKTRPLDHETTDSAQLRWQLIMKHPRIGKSRNEATEYRMTL
jgi:hypothetical protein